MSIFDMLQRPLVIILAAVLLDEPLTVWQGIGVALVLGGVQLAKVSRKNAGKIQPTLVSQATISTSGKPYAINV